MDELSATSCDIYRSVVRGDKDFVPYFRSATPEQELSKLPLALALQNVIQTVAWKACVPFHGFLLVAKPQCYQHGLVWCSYSKIMDEGKGHIIEEMCEAWPFFSLLWMLKWCSVKPIFDFPNTMIINLVKKSFGT